MKSQIMKRAWEIRKEAASRFNCKLSEIHFSDCLRQSWAESRKGKKMENLKGRKYRFGSGALVYFAPKGTVYYVMENHSRSVVAKYDNRTDAKNKMVDVGLEAGKYHSVLAEEPGNDELILLEQF